MRVFNIHFEFFVVAADCKNSRKHVSFCECFLLAIRARRMDTYVVQANFLFFEIQICPNFDNNKCFLFSGSGRGTGMGTGMGTG